MNIVCDASLSPRLARSLRELLAPGRAVTHVRDALGDQATDQAIATFVHSASPSMVLSVDLDISDNPHRMLALRAWRCPVFLLSAAWLELEPTAQAWMLIRMLPAMLAKAGAGDAPVIYSVPPGPKGRIRKAMG
jgi:hypothetical protein